MGWGEGRWGGKRGRVGDMGVSKGGKGAMEMVKGCGIGKGRGKREAKGGG